MSRELPPVIRTTALTVSKSLVSSGSSGKPSWSQ